MFKNALVSVSDKQGLAEFLKPLVQKGLRLTSTGGTAKYLIENGFQVRDISELTGFPEVMGGRVKTLHPRVHMSILAREDEVADEQLLVKEGLQLFDLVICNLYPFEQTLRTEKSKEVLDFDNVIENIDIGGPTLLRASAKNHQRVTVICDPQDYKWIGELSEAPSRQVRQTLAAKVFYHVSAYDSLIAQTLAPQDAFFSDKIQFDDYSIGANKASTLRYGENPLQKALWLKIKGEQGLQDAHILQGKELSYNNILDLDAATELLNKFGQTAAVVVKHNNPCGVAIGTTAAEVIQKSFDADPVSCFGGIVAVNAPVDQTAAESLNKIFLECVIAPAFTVEAKAILDKKKNLRLLEWPGIGNSFSTLEIKGVKGGFLLQERDKHFAQETNWQFIGEKPGSQMIEDMRFGEKVCGALKSNAIAVVKNGCTLGLGMGQVNRVDAVLQALERMKKHHGLVQGAVLVSDAFFPFKDSVELIASYGVKCILQPGGSIKDSEVVECAKQLGISMALSGVRHFKH